MMWLCLYLQAMTFRVHWNGLQPSVKRSGQKSAHLNHGSELDKTDSSLRVEHVSLPRVEEFKYVRVFFLSDDRTEWKMNS